MTTNKHIAATTTTLLAAVAAGAVLAGPAAAQGLGTTIVDLGSTSGAPTPTKTVVIGLDGTMLDQIKAADAPRLNQLIAEGTSGESSIAGHPTISGPSWSTILTGVWNDKHGVQDNSFAGARYDQYPTAFTRIETANPELHTQSISTWDGIATIAGSGSPAADVVTTTANAGSVGATDTATATAVANQIASAGPDFIFTQLDQVDGAGHAAGTDGPGYQKALTRVDAEVGRIVDAVDRRAADTGEQWTILVTADHGHKPTGGHGGQTPEEATTFVIARGAGYAAGATDNGYTIADITPTVLTNLGVALPDNLDGAPLAKTAAVLPVFGS
ncbi:alkaline phosphatase family protein [Rhodococcus sp. NPDC058505]|uniref:alkaline phosphatase family protein n=1 Tax=unclassified Rhodococcus (in: high G+C Gram-positive bacteria) TaxID=192944 RepID=UPI003668E1CD